MHISGFNDKGEAKVSNDDGELIACGELHLVNGWQFPTRMSDYGLSIKLTWVKDEE